MPTQDEEKAHESVDMSVPMDFETYLEKFGSSWGLQREVNNIPTDIKEHMMKYMQGEWARKGCAHNLATSNHQIAFARTLAKHVLGWCAEETQITKANKKAAEARASAEARAEGEEEAAAEAPAPAPTGKRKGTEAAAPAAPKTSARGKTPAPAPARKTSRCGKTPAPTGTKRAAASGERACRRPCRRATPQPLEYPATLTIDRSDALSVNATYDKVDAFPGDAREQPMSGAPIYRNRNENAIHLFCAKSGVWWIGHYQPATEDVYRGAGAKIKFADIQSVKWEIKKKDIKKLPSILF